MARTRLAMIRNHQEKNHPLPPKKTPDLFISVMQEQCAYTGDTKEDAEQFTIT
jgi:hypothetical protein